MATIKEDFVSFETAKLLKEKGFQQLQDNCEYFTTEMVYSIDIDDNGEHHFAHQYPAGVYNKDKYIAAPTLQMAMKWLREKHLLHISIDMVSGGKWKYEIDDISCPFDGGVLPKCYCHKFFCSYEEGINDAIKYCLENLI